jgi:hypothetical protein
MVVWNPGKKPQRRPKLFDVPHRSQILCLNLIKYYSSWLHVSSQLSLLDGFFIIRKYNVNELNHRDRVQINVKNQKNI